MFWPSGFAIATGRLLQKQSIAFCAADVALPAWPASGALQRLDATARGFSAGAPRNPIQLGGQPRRRESLDGIVAESLGLQVSAQSAKNRTIGPFLRRTARVPPADGPISRRWSPRQVSVRPARDNSNLESYSILFCNRSIILLNYLGVPGCKTGAKPVKSRSPKSFANRVQNSLGMHLFNGPFLGLALKSSGSLDSPAECGDGWTRQML